MTTAEKLVLLRGKRRREEVARAVGISPSALETYEQASRMPRDEVKVKLARYYGTTVQALFFTDKCHEKWPRTRSVRHETDEAEHPQL